MNVKFCNKCKKEKEIKNFYKRGKYYCSQCKECMNKNNKEWYSKNKEKVKNRNKKYREENWELTRNLNKKWKENNKEHVKKYKREKYHIDKNDKFYKLKIQTRHLIFKAFERKGYKKDSKTEEILGCNYEKFIKHLIETYKINYGKEWDGKERVHIDHIRPLATAQTEEDIIRLNHYTNLQLLKMKDNLKKSNKLDWRLDNVIR